MVTEMKWKEISCFGLLKLKGFPVPNKTVPNRLII